MAVPWLEEYVKAWSKLPGDLSGVEPWELIAQISRLVLTLGNGESRVLGTVHPTATVVRSYVAPGAHVWDYANVRDAVLLENCVVGHGSEVVRSVLFPSCSLPRFNYVGGSVLGEDVRLGGAATMATRRHDDRRVFVRLGGRVVDTGLRKFGCVVGDHARIGFAAHLNPGTLVGRGAFVGPYVDLRSNVPHGAGVVVQQGLRLIPNVRGVVGELLGPGAERDDERRGEEGR